MYHTIVLTTAIMVDLSRSPKEWLERLLLEEGTRLRTQVRPYVIQTDDEVVEVADLFLEDGSTALSVPFECFAFVD